MSAEPAGESRLREAGDPAIDASPGEQFGLMSAVEILRCVPTQELTFPVVTLIHVLSGKIDLCTDVAIQRLAPGSAVALGSYKRHQLLPLSPSRLWVIYADEPFIRAQMRWLLRPRQRVRRGVHPDDWDGNSLVLTPGIDSLRRLEPIWRQLSMLPDTCSSPEEMSIRTIELLARWVGVVAPVFLTEENRSLHLPTRNQVPASGRQANPAMIGHVGRAARLLRERMDEPWTVASLAQELALSRTHLTRLFSTHMGVSPMRFLTEVRLTEFSRLIDETDLSVHQAAQTVGWADPRVASAWFSRRFGVTPTRYRHRLPATRGETA